MRAPALATTFAPSELGKLPGLPSLLAGLQAAEQVWSLHAQRESRGNAEGLRRLLLALIKDGTISGSLGKQVFEIMLETGDDPAKIVEEKGLKQTSDTGAIEAVIADVIARSPGQLEQYRGGKEQLFGYFVGQTMKAMGGKANPGVVNDLLKKALA